MSNPIKILVTIVLMFYIILIGIDYFKVENSKQVLFDTVRETNYNSLYFFKDKTVISEIEMLEQWLVNYAYSSNLTVDEVKIDFLLVSTDPTYYMVSIVGDNKYTFIDESVYIQCVSSAAFVR